MEAPSFDASGWITLTTDFGLRDPYVGVLKAVMSARQPQVRLFDLTHDIPAYQPAIAGFWLARCWPYFPAGTVHLAVVDPGVGSERAMTAVQLAGQLFIAPDNGLLEAVYRSQSGAQWRRFTTADLLPGQPGKISPTFHGRDIFAPLVADISANIIKPESLGTLQLPSFGPLPHRIITIDHYGNLLTDIPREAIQERAVRALQFRNHQVPIVTTYSDASPGTIVALVNAWGMLEIARVQGNAAQQLGATIGEPVSTVATTGKPGH